MTACAVDDIADATMHQRMNTMGMVTMTASETIPPNHLRTPMLAQTHIAVFPVTGATRQGGFVGAVRGLTRPRRLEVSHPPTPTDCPDADASPDAPPSRCHRSLVRRPRSIPRRASDSPSSNTVWRGGTGGIGSWHDRRRHLNRHQGPALFTRHTPRMGRFIRRTVIAP